jgi:hypothetical protein
VEEDDEGRSNRRRADRRRHGVRVEAAGFRPMASVLLDIYELLFPAFVLSSIAIVSGIAFDGEAGSRLYWKSLNWPGHTKADKKLADFIPLTQA